MKGVLPYLTALFLNAFTDLGHKILIQNTVFKIYDNQEQIILTAILNALILLPFIALFTPAGFLSQRFSRSHVMRYGALSAIFITLGITFAYYQGWFWCAFGFTLLLGMQAALYSPAKYGYITDLVKENRLSALNALVQSVTTVAILAGIMVYTLLFETSLHSSYTSESDILKQIAPLGWLLVGGSVVEYLLTLRLPSKNPVSEAPLDLRRYLKGFYFRKNWLAIRRNESILEAIIVLSLFWSISQVILASFGAYAKSTLHQDNTIVVQGLMALAAFGIIAGSFIASRVSRYYIHHGLIPMGSIILTFTLLLLPFATSLALIGSLFFLFGIGGAMMIVSLNAHIQSSVYPTRLGYVLAGNNWMQNIFMTGFLILTTLGAMAGMNSLYLFWIMFAVSLLLSLWLIKRHGDYLLWLFFEKLLSLRYDIKPINLHHIPPKGGVLLVGNHISWIDWLLVQVGISRRISYLMERSIYELPIIRPIMKLGRVIPISARSSKDAFKTAKVRLQNGEIIGIFPEGEISYNGEVGKINSGYQKIADSCDGVIVPFYIDGIYGSVLSRSSKRYTSTQRWFRREIRIIYGTPLPMNSNPDMLYNAINTLKENHAIK
jgi:acyl-[acyl-carrier-protein]-phospholipid O-acyltransferase/long-chain-fatty-acid--[acyl-carrier-protein] ligase